MAAMLTSESHKILLRPLEYKKKKNQMQSRIK